MARWSEPWEMVVMSHQEATCVLPFPLKIVESRLADVESWDRFLVGLQGVHRTAHERYLFRMDSGREIRVAVRAHPREHRFAWHAFDGPMFDGTLRLTALDEVLTRVTLSIRTRDVGVTADLMDLAFPRTWLADFDVQRLATFVADGSGASARRATIESQPRIQAWGPRPADPTRVQPHRWAPSGGMAAPLPGPRLTTTIARRSQAFGSCISQRRTEMRPAAK